MNCTARIVRLAVALGAFYFACSAQAAIVVWSGPGVDLADGANWGGVAPTAADDAEFSSGTAPDPTLGDLSVLSLYFTETSKSYNIGGGTLTINGVNLDTYRSAQPQTISSAVLSVTTTVNSSARGVVAGSDVLGTGKLTIASPVFNFSAAGGGNIRAANADLDITSTVFTATGGGTQTINAQNAGRTITIMPAINVGNGLSDAATDNISFNGAGTTFANGGFTGTGTLASTGGNVTKAGTGSLILGSSGTWDGKVTISAGTLQIRDSASLGAGGASGGNTTLTNTTSTLALNPNTTINLNETINVTTRTSTQTAHILNMSGDNTLSGNVQITAGSASAAVVHLKSDSGTLNLTGTITNGLALPRSAFFLGAGNSIISGTNNLVETSAAGRLSVDKREAGKLTITGSQNYTGGTAIRAGHLEIQNSSSLGLGGNATGFEWTAVLFDPSAALVLNGVGEDLVTNENIYFRGKASVAGSLINSAGNNKLTGRLENEIHADGQDEITLQVDAGSLELSGIIAQTLTFNTTLHLGGVGPGKISGTMVQENTGVWNLAKEDAGTWTISANQNYTGTTTVNAGKLLVNGTNSGGGTYNVAADGTLGGTGSIGGSEVTVAPGGKLAPGASVGTFAVGSAAIQGTLAIEYNGDSDVIDLLNIAGSLNISGATLSFANVGTGGLNGSPHIFASYGSLIGGTFGTVVGLPAGYSINYNYLNGNQIAIVSAHPGDFDSDGDVDGADFVAWQTNFPTATGATRAQGDADGDGDVDGADFVVWQTNFPFTPGPGVATVPEPGSLMLALVAVGGAIGLRRRSSRGENG
jgi:fibronectin-binding autotransporter adhesin